MTRDNRKREEEVQGNNEAIVVSKDNIGLDTFFHRAVNNWCGVLLGFSLSAFEAFGTGYSQRQGARLDRAVS